MYFERVLEKLETVSISQNILKKPSVQYIQLLFCFKIANRITVCSSLIQRTICFK